MEEIFHHGNQRTTQSNEIITLSALNHQAITSVTGEETNPVFLTKSISTNEIKGDDTKTKIEFLSLLQSGWINSVTVEVL